MKINGGHIRKFYHFLFFFTGVFLIGPGDQGILYEHREMEFGDNFNESELLDALAKIKLAAE